MAQAGRRAAASVVAGVLAGLIATGPAHAALRAQFVPLTVPAQARPAVVVVVVPTSPAGEELAARVNRVVREAAQKSGRFDVQSLIDRLDAENARGRESRAAEGLEALKSARAAYNELDTVQALKEAERAIKAFGDSDLGVHLPDLSKAWILKIASLVANGENKAAQLEMDRLLAIDPSATFSPNYFPPEEIAYAENVRKQLLEAKMTLEVKTTPPGAEIFVDGHYQGLSPLTVDKLAPGDHYVTAKRPGYALGQQRSRPGTAELTLRKAEAFPRYEALVTKVAKDPRGPQRDAAANELGQWLGVDQVLLGVVDVPPGASTAQVTLLRLEPKDGHNDAYAEESVPLGESAVPQVEALASRVLSHDDPRRGGPVTHYEVPGAADAKKVAGYALLGAGAAVFVGGIAFGIAANGQHNEFRRLAQTDPHASSVASTGRTLAVVADVSYLVGLLAAGGGTYLAFLSGPKSAAPAPKQAETPKASAQPPAEKEKKERAPDEEKDERREAPRQDEDDLRNY
ncbi:MAG: PEGA domain-containing protein [Myxococcaceae bacterium]|nr:PEGA domain-containing protein [Myxococcaceae bacterium]